MNEELLPPDHLTTMDKSGKRIYLYPAAVTGIYRSRKTIVHSCLVLFFLILPWIHVHGNQLLLLDVAQREFFVFGLHFRAHDTPLLLFLILIFTFGIALITALWGRLWCGWACPQTVFIEGIFRRIEVWVEGNHRHRSDLDKGPWTSKKIVKKSLKYFLFTLVALVITHSFLAYFVGSYEIIAMMKRPPEQNWTSFLVILFTTAVVIFDFGWFKEQFCTIMCPYGRFQSVLMDSHSLVVAYDEKRGEPRRTWPASPTQGDCVSCQRCVQVCPTGIDIRHGIQMECIACTACIDACDEVMIKNDKPRGLIRYTTLRELRGQVRQLLRPRTIVYSALLVVALIGMTFALGTKDFLDLVIFRAKDIPYQVLDGGTKVINHFQAEVSNQTGKEIHLFLTLAPEDQARGVEFIFPFNGIGVKDSDLRRLQFFVKFPKTVLQKGSTVIHLESSGSGTKKKLEVTLVGPDA